VDALSGAGLQALLEFLRELYQHLDVDEFAPHVVQALMTLVPADLASFNEVDTSTGRSRTIVTPTGADRFPGSEEVFARHVREHPFVANSERMGDGRAHRLSDFMTRVAFRRLPLYNEYYRRIGTEHQLAVPLPSRRPLLRGFVLSRRAPDYSERERTLMTLMAPHVVQAYRNAEAMTRARRSAAPGARDATDTEVVLLSARGGVQFATPRARRWLAAYFGESVARDSRVPAELRAWARAQEHALDARGDAPAPRIPLVVRRDGGSLEIRFASEPGQRALLVRERRRGIVAPALEPLGLSPREAQVLAWVAEGKTNVEIGVILGARPRTVAKHLEHIFRKLGVETRTAAAAAALTRTAAP